MLTLLLSLWRVNLPHFIEDLAILSIPPVARQLQVCTNEFFPISLDNYL